MDPNIGSEWQTAYLFFYIIFSHFPSDGVNDQLADLRCRALAKNEAATSTQPCAPYRLLQESQLLGNEPTRGLGDIKMDLVHPQNESPFFANLPAEIRLLIYREALEPDMTLAFTPCRWNQPPEVGAYNDPIPEWDSDILFKLLYRNTPQPETIGRRRFCETYSNLMSLCKRMYDETWSLPFEDDTFEVVLPKAIKRMNTVLFRRARRVRIRLRYRQYEEICKSYTPVTDFFNHLFIPLLQKPNNLQDLTVVVEFPRRVWPEMTEDSALFFSAKLDTRIGRIDIEKGPASEVFDQHFSFSTDRVLHAVEETLQRNYEAVQGNSYNPRGIPIHMKRHEQPWIAPEKGWYAATKNFFRRIIMRLWLGVVVVFVFIYFMFAALVTIVLISFHYCFDMFKSKVNEAVTRLRRP